MNAAQESGHRERNEGRWALLILRALATSIELVLHDPRTCGERYLGPQAGVAALILLLYPALWPHDDPIPVLGYLVVFLVSCAATRVGAASRRKQGLILEHSYYSGAPRLRYLTRKLGEARVKEIVEPLIVMVVGGILTAITPALGSYLIGSRSAIPIPAGK